MNLKQFLKQKPYKVSHWTNWLLGELGQIWNYNVSVMRNFEIDWEKQTITPKKKQVLITGCTFSGFRQDLPPIIKS